MEFQDVLDNRYSCRKYDDQQVEPEKPFSPDSPPPHAVRNDLSAFAAATL